MSNKTIAIINGGTYLQAMNPNGTVIAF